MNIASNFDSAYSRADLIKSLLTDAINCDNDELRRDLIADVLYQMMAALQLLGVTTSLAVVEIAKSHNIVYCIDKYAHSSNSASSSSTLERELDNSLTNNDGEDSEPF